MVNWHLPDVADLDDVQLSSVLRNINRWTAEGRLRAAQNPATRSYLQAGLRLLAEALMPPEDGEEATDPVIHPLVAFLSRKKVVDEVNEEAHPELPRRGSVGGLRDLWDPHRDYLMDLLRTALLEDAWVSAVPATTKEQVLALGDPISMVRALALANARSVPKHASFRFQLLATLLTAHEPELHEPLVEAYETLNRSWSEVFGAVIAAQGYKLREGITLEMLTNMLMALAEGLSLRIVAAPDPVILDDEKGTTLMETAALALLSSCVEPLDGDVSFEDYVRARFGGQHQDPGAETPRRGLA
ncbi:hypothetical protein [Granulicoccus sp. GXG6511]|uniref:hypothetical protein n=1 Tax=Granulicoccus sp. GXG6511 TaxID=3381351 RepID=UPI003D7C92C9